jgi:hypothetical protein
MIAVMSFVAVLFIGSIAGCILGTIGASAAILLVPSAKADKAYQRRLKAIGASHLPKMCPEL